MPSPTPTSHAPIAAASSTSISPPRKSRRLQWHGFSSNTKTSEQHGKDRNGESQSPLGGGHKGSNSNPVLLHRPVLGNDESARRPSVAFIPTSSEVALPSVVQAQRRSSKDLKRPASKQRRMSSPPPPPPFSSSRYRDMPRRIPIPAHRTSIAPKGVLKPNDADSFNDYNSVFRPRVSFDTFDSRSSFIEENSFTLIRKHKDYEYTKRSRTFLIGLDSNDYSEYALEWLIEELVDDGDEIVALRVIDKDSDKSRGRVSVDTGRYKHEAEKLMNHVQAKNADTKAINLILEFAVGKVNKVIADMINLYEPAILIVGTRGRSLGGFQGLLPGSVSKYCLQHSPVPVIVVRPDKKRQKIRLKRANDPSRQGYERLITRASMVGGVGSTPGSSLNSPTTSTPHNNSLSADPSSTHLAPVAGTTSSSASGDVSPLPPRSTTPLPSHSPAAPGAGAGVTTGPAVSSSSDLLDKRNARNGILDSKYASELVWGSSTPTPVLSEREEAAAVAEAIGFKERAHPHYAHVGEPHHLHHHNSLPITQPMEQVQEQFGAADGDQQGHERARSLDGGRPGGSDGVELGVAQGAGTEGVPTTETEVVDRDGAGEVDTQNMDVDTGRGEEGVGPTAVMADDDDEGVRVDDVGIKSADAAGDSPSSPDSGLKDVEEGVGGVRLDGGDTGGDAGKS